MPVGEPIAFLRLEELPAVPNCCLAVPNDSQASASAGVPAGEAPPRIATVTRRPPGWTIKHPTWTAVSTTNKSPLAMCGGNPSFVWMACRVPEVTRRSSESDLLRILNSEGWPSSGCMRSPHGRRS